MKRRLTLTTRYLLLIAAVMAVFITATLIITTQVMKSGMASIFQQRVDRAKTVLAQYESGHALSRSQEMDAVLSSPRFIAAVETGDSSTISLEAPVYQRILGSDVLLLTNKADKITYLYGAPMADANTIIRETITDIHSETPIRYVALDHKIYEFAVNEIHTDAGNSLGWILAGKEFSFAMARELKRLTGLDVIVTQDSSVLGYTESPFIHRLISQPKLLDRMLTSDQGARLTIDGEEVMYSTLPAEASNAVISFIGSLDENVAPIKTKIMFYLIILALGGGVVAMGVIYVLTERQIGRQVNHLVGVAERIASGSLDFSIQPQSTDELGYLAGEMEKMRARIVADRAALEDAHIERVKGEKMAALGQMATGIIHDLKNPMGVIRGTVELIQVRQPDKERLHKYCLTINDQIDRMIDLAQDILDYSKGRIRLEIKPENLATYFDSVRDFHSSLYQSAGIRLSLKGPKDLVLGIDSGKFRRVIDNVLNNAREALKPGQSVNIQWYADDSGARIAIEDDGPGIPEEIKDRLFEPFVTSKKEGGTGLGLAIARKIIEDHGGTITVVSEPNGGTRFLISIPSTLASREPVEMAVEVGG